MIKPWQLIACAVVAVVLLVCYALVVAKLHWGALRVGAVTIAAYLVAVAAILFIPRLIPGSARGREDRAGLTRTVLDGIDKADTVMILCRNDGSVVWCNEGLAAVMPDGKKPYGKTVFEITGVTVDELREASSPSGIGVEIGDSYFIASSYVVRNGRADLLVTAVPAMRMKELAGELELFRTQIEESDLVVAYIFIDNLTEMIQYESESFRPATTKIDEYLREWAAEVKGIIKEFERDRYLLVFEKRYLSVYIDRKFDVLDRIRDIRVGEEKLPVTVSVGIASVTGQFSEKERAARAAIDMALGRGGDQVVLKLDDSTEYFGGRSRASLKRSGVRSRVVSNELLMHISRSSGVLIMGHKYPDYDSIGACVGLSKIVEFCGVEAHIVADPEDANVKRCREIYDGVGEGVGKLFISPAEAQDSIRTDTFVILTDVNNIAISEAPDLISVPKCYAVIDHHRKHSEFEREPVVEYIETKSSSACELVAEMMEQVLPSGFIGAGEAGLMLAGIILDTKKFTRSTGSRTYGAALYLHDNGAMPETVQELFKTGLDSFVKEARFLSGVRIYRQCVAIAVCGESDGEGGDKIT
ncbi:MAG: DHH family phosphoesterase, partial [Firmicutes bacterium]|nr:DHH family phosphoesterase [Bacillota bacterium]